MTHGTAHSHGGYTHHHPHRGRHRHLRHRVASAGPPYGALASPVYRRLLLAQVISLAGTGITTVALGLLAYEIGGASAGAVLGIALGLKMVAFVGCSPVIAAYSHRIDRRRLMVGLDLLRAAALGLAPFLTHAWQLLALVFVVNAAAAGFTPAFQATIPDVLPDEDDYTLALSFSRIAYDLADLLSPVAAAALLLLVDFHALFALDAFSFLLSAALIASVTLPRPAATKALADRSWARITVGLRQFVSYPSLRAVLALNIAAAAASAMVIVNTVVIVRGTLHLDASHVALALGASGAGSIAATLAIPTLLRRVSDRTAMLAGSAAVVAALVATTGISSYAQLLAIWSATGIGLALIQTPIGRVVRRAAPPADRPALFAAQFALSHAGWLVAYPIAGVLGAVIGIPAVAIVLAGLALAAAAVATRLWHSEPR